MRRSKKAGTNKRTGFLLFAVCLILTGCGKKESDIQGETTDIFGVYTISPSGALRDEDGKNYLRFYDRESDSIVYLCNRAGCRHIDHNCAAYFENMQEAFFYNDDLYVIISVPWEDSQIFRADRYGENRELLGTMPDPALQQEIIGNEFYFFGIIWEDVSDTSRRSAGLMLCILNLDTGDCENIPNVDTGYPNTSLEHFTVTDDFIYLSYTASSVDISDFFDFDTGELKDITWDEIVYTTLLYRMDRNTKETELVYTREKTGGTSTGGITVLEEKENSLILSRMGRIFEYDLQTGEETVLYESADEEIYVHKLRDHYLISSYWEHWSILLKDWQEVASFSWDDYEIDSYHGISGDAIYFSYFSGNTNLCWIAYNDLIDGNYDFHHIDF